MLDAVFDDLLSHQEEIGTTLREGLRDTTRSWASVPTAATS